MSGLGHTVGDARKRRHTCGQCDEPIASDHPAFISIGGVTVAYYHEGDDPTFYQQAQWDMSGVRPDQTQIENLAMHEDEGLPT